MRIKFLLLLSVLSFSNCNSVEEKEADKKEKSTEEKIVKEEKNENDFQILPLENSFPSPFLPNYQAEKTGSITLQALSENKVEVKISLNDNTTHEFSFDPSELIPRISKLAFGNNYHQQLSVYLFEKQNHTIHIEDPTASSGQTYYEITNPPRGEFWFLNLISEKNGAKEILASYRFQLPEAWMEKCFEKVNNRKYAEFKNYIHTAPPTQKIEYNSLRRMSKFFEGFAANMNEIDFDYSNYSKNSLYLNKNTPKKLSDFYGHDFNFPAFSDKGYDSTKMTSHSLNELFASHTFTYKLAYPLTGGKDSLLEMQIDFKNQQNTPTVRFVMGGIVFSEIPRLKGEEMHKGLYLPIGFAPYKNPSITTETYVTMGNTSGYWVDNSYGRNIDGVLIYFDKNSSIKMHIWLMGGDGTLPVGHYITNLDQLKK